MDHSGDQLQDMASNQYIQNCDARNNICFKQMHFKYTGQ